MQWVCLVLYRVRLVQGMFGAEYDRCRVCLVQGVRLVQGMFGAVGVCKVHKTVLFLCILCLIKYIIFCFGEREV